MERTMTGQDHFRSGLLETLPGSPYKILDEHFKRVCKATRKLNRMVRFYLEGNFNEAASLSVEISRLEQEADELKRNLRASLPRKIFMPIAKEDLLDVLRYNERIVDTCQDVAQLLDMRETRVPEDLHPLYERFLGHIVDAVDSLRDMMNLLGRVLESAFAKVETKEVIALGQLVHEHEYKADSVNKQLSKAIYALEDKESPMALFHMMKFSDVLDSVADHAENSALKLVLVVSK
jgi:predicted phosphate transport protein (TIGR00153 family)